MTAIKYAIGGKPWVVSGDVRKPVLDTIGRRIADELEAAILFHPGDYEEAYDAFVRESQRKSKPPTEDTSAVERFRRIITNVLVSTAEDVNVAIPALRFAPLQEPMKS